MEASDYRGTSANKLLLGTAVGEEGDTTYLKQQAGCAPCPLAGTTTLTEHQPIVKPLVV